MTRMLWNVNHLLYSSLGHLSFSKHSFSTTQIYLYISNKLIQSKIFDLYNSLIFAFSFS
jgi:hypothetical protein